MEFDYFTIKNDCEGFYKEKGSKFISYGFFINDEVEVKDRLEKIKKQHHAARHVCYAYMIGANKDKYRVNDDGEPLHTAGTPILNQIRSKNVTNVLVIVVRYFGGSKLGKSGLINAYKEAALSCLENASIVIGVLEKKIKFSFHYNNLGRIHTILDSMDAGITDQKMSEECYFEVKVREKSAEALCSSLKNFVTFDCN